MPAATLAALLRVARDLTIQDRFDVEAAQRLLGNLPRDDLDSQILGAVKHARKVVSAAALADTSGRSVPSRFLACSMFCILDFPHPRIPDARMR